MAHYNPDINNLNNIFDRVKDAVVDYSSHLIMEKNKKVRALYREKLEQCCRIYSLPLITTDKGRKDILAVIDQLDMERDVDDYETRLRDELGKRIGINMVTNYFSVTKEEPGQAPTVVTLWNSLLYSEYGYLQAKIDIMEGYKNILNSTKKQHTKVRQLIKHTNRESTVLQKSRNTHRFIERLWDALDNLLSDFGFAPCNRGVTGAKFTDNLYSIFTTNKVNAHNPSHLYQSGDSLDADDRAEFAAP